jgi:selenide,water dikinase
LNREAAVLANEFELCGGTDVTGFSLLGHASEIAEASGVSLRFRLSAIPFLSCARKYGEEWIFPGGTSDNRLYFSQVVRFEPGIDEIDQMLLFDAQTSGGLLLAVPHERLPSLLERAQALEQPAWVVGDVKEGYGVEVIAG